MSAVKTIFKAIDILFDPAQNTRKESRDPNNLVSVDTDIIYDESCPDACLLDVYRVAKEGGSKYPVAFYIHGGAWEAGDKKYRAGISKWFALNGWFVVNINYGLSPKYKYPVPMQQIVTAYNWIGKNAEKYNLDLENIIVTGDSAGAYFALMVAAIDKSPVLQEKLGCKTDFPVQGLVLDCGMYDLRHAFVSKRIVFNLGDALLKDYVDAGRNDFDNSEYADYLSPIEYITDDFPPCFVSYSKKDVFCGGQGELLIMQLRKHGIYYEGFHSIHFVNNHCFPINTRGKEAQVNNEMTMDFMQRFRNRNALENWHVEADKEHKKAKILQKRARHSLKHAEHRTEKVARKLEKRGED